MLPHARAAWSSFQSSSRTIHHTRSCTHTHTAPYYMILHSYGLIHSFSANTRTPGQFVRCWDKIGSIFTVVPRAIDSTSSFLAFIHSFIPMDRVYGLGARPERELDGVIVESVSLSKSVSNKRSAALVFVQSFVRRNSYQPFVPSLFHKTIMSSTTTKMMESIHRLRTPRRLRCVHRTT